MADRSDSHFRFVLEKERESIRERRRLRDGRPDEGLFGVTLSGGGIRSASFCLGALQALDQYGLIRRMDYLSTVSGGGYIGASMVAAMTAGPAGTAAAGKATPEAKGKAGETDDTGNKADRSFPFASGTDHDVRDNVAVGHVRDHSRFLAPRGFGDILLSLAILLRGLVVNLLLLLSVLLPLAMIVVITNPTTRHLDQSIWLDIARWASPGWDRGPGQTLLGSIVADPLLMTKAIVVVLALSLVGWALWRSFVESFYGAFGSATLEHDSRWARWGRYLIVSLLFVFLVEVQPRIVAILLGFVTEPKDGGVAPGTTGLKVLVASATAIVAATATFRGTLIAWIQKALSSPTIGARLQAAFAQGAFYALGLALPLLIYGLFLMLIIFAVKVVPCKDCGHGYLFAPDFLAARNWWLISMLAGLAAVFTVVRWVLITFVAKYKGPGKVGGALKTLWRRGSGKVTALMIAVFLVFLGVSAIATRPEWGNWFGQDDELMVLANYLAITLAIVVLGVNFTENANGLHRLYRDRLSVAFRLGHPISGASLKLHQLGDHSPYLLVNGTLNVRRPRAAAADEDAPATQRRRTSAAADDGDASSGSAPGATKSRGLWRQNLDAATSVRKWMSGGGRRDRPTPSSRVVQQRLPERPHPDPAKRGRNAEFFVFSRHFVGSNSTGYVASELLAKEEPQLDLASAVAISGAAVSSSMGRISVGWLGPTLALLNLRLGFWLRNPKYVRAATGQTEDSNRRSATVDPSANSSWEDILRLYLFAEAFGRLRSDSSRIYITDGGHIDNIGLYQLLKRQCKFMIVIDAEADPGMNFGAFSDVQRFARIDEGVLISLDWWPVRTAALARSADRTKQVPRDSETHKRHFAVGRIIYEDGEEGILLYIKATVTGDEPDYVLDYERRYPNFPHEATSDQFFSEEQMEAYRALGFHATRHALDEGKDAAAPKQPAPAKTEPAKKGRSPAKTVAKAAPEPQAGKPSDASLIERDMLVRKLKEGLGVQVNSIAEKRRAGAQ